MFQHLQNSLNIEIKKRRNNEINIGDLHRYMGYRMESERRDCLDRGNTRTDDNLRMRKGCSLRNGICGVP